MPDKLDGKIAWVTGAGTGIGEAAAVALAEEGATVVLTGRRKEPLQAVAAASRTAARRGGGGRPDQGTHVDGVVQRIVAKFSRLDILVNNAGVNIVDRAWKKITPDGIDTLVHGNLSSAFYCARAVLPQMRAQGGGQLIHTASMAGRNIGPLSGPGYVAAKHAVVAMSHSINMEECVNGIRSTVVCPGEVNTPILKNRPEPALRRRTRANAAAGTLRRPDPLRRLPAGERHDQRGLDHADLEPRLRGEPAAGAAVGPTPASSRRARRRAPVRGAPVRPAGR